MITLHPKPGIELLVVEVPEGFKFTCIKGNDFYFKADVWNFEQIGHLIGLPPGNYSFIATSRDITEEQAAEIMDWEWTWGRLAQVKRYKDFIEGLCVLIDARPSLFSLLRSQGLDPSTKNYAILKKL